MCPTLAIVGKNAATPLYAVTLRNGTAEYQTIDQAGWNLAFELGELGGTVLDLTEGQILARPMTRNDKERVRDSKFRFGG